MEARESSRQEIAERLRDKYNERNAPWTLEAQDVGMQAYDYLHDLIDCLPDGDSAFTVIADLIDPTCHIAEYVSGEPAEYDCDDVTYYCSGCGYGCSVYVQCEDGSAYAEAPRFCPHCGARVVDE